MAVGTKDWKQAAPLRSFLQLLREGNAFACSRIVAAVVAEFAISQIYNPVDSGVDLFIEGCDLNANNTSVFVVGQTDYNSAGGATKDFNRNVGSSNESKALFYEYTEPGLSYNMYYRRRSSTNSIVSIDNIYLWIPEGHHAHIFNSTAGNSLTVLWRWFEFTDY
jgi:hypothetical protein